MNTSHPFKWRHFQAEIILLCVRWYLRYPLSYRDPELERRGLPHLNATNDSWRVDETYIKVKKAWMYLYRAVDAQGNTLEFLLSPRRDASLGQTLLRESAGCTS